MSDTVKIELTKDQAEALYAYLQLPLDEHFVFNNTEGLTFLENADDRDEDAEDDVSFMDDARLVAARQLFPQLTDAARRRHDSV